MLNMSITTEAAALYSKTASDAASISGIGCCAHADIGNAMMHHVDAAAIRKETAL